jgi:hypothetical protein
MNKIWPMLMLIVGVCLLGQLVRVTIWDFRSTESKRAAIRRHEQRRLRKASKR